MKFLRKLKSFAEVIVAAVFIATAAAFFGYYAWAVSFGSNPSVYCQGESSQPEVVHSSTPPDNIWDIANRRFPSADTRIVVDRIEEMNDLQGKSLQPNQHIRVPESCG